MSNYSDSHFDESAANTSWYKVFHLVPEGSKVLDVGCSSGNFGVELIKRKKCVVDGLELNSSDAKLAAKKLRKVFVKNIESDSLGELDRNYDVIYFGDVVEHLVDPAAALRKISKHLSKDGVILFSIPNMAHISVRILLLGGVFDYTETGLLDKTHLHFYTLKEVERVFNEAGLKLNHLDFVKKDYPEKLLMRELKKSGLTPGAKFFKLCKQADASAFQFVGTASPSKNVKAIKLEQYGPIDHFETFYNDTVANYQNEIARLKDELGRRNKTASKVKRLVSNPRKVISSKLKKIVK